MAWRNQILDLLHLLIHWFLHIHHENERQVCVMIWLLLVLTLLFVQPLNFNTLQLYLCTSHMYDGNAIMYVTRIIQSMELMRQKMSTKSILLLCCCYISDVSFPQWRMTGCCWLAVCRSLALSEGKQTPRNLSKQPRVTQDNVGSLACQCTVGKHVDIEMLLVTPAIVYNTMHVNWQDIG